MVTTSLGDLIKVKSGDGIAVSHLHEYDKYPVYGGNGINGYTTANNVETGTMIIGRVGEKCGNVNITASNSWVSDNALIVTPKAKYDIKYLKYLLEHTNLNSRANRNAQPVISGQIIYKIEVPYITDTKEQTLVGQMIHQFDTHIANLTELIEKKKAIRDGALEDLVSGRTRLDGFSSEWKDANIGSITSEIITGGTPSTTISSYWGGTIPWLASTEIHQKRITRPTTFITESGIRYSAAKIAPKDSVLIALAGQGKTRGTAAFLAQDMAINQSLAALVVNEKADANFLFYAMERSYLRLRELSSGDGGRGGLNKKLLKQFTIPFTLDTFEQKAIADILITIDIEIVSLEEEKDKMLQIKAGAMDDLLTGRVRLM